MGYLPAPSSVRTANGSALILPPVSTGTAGQVLTIAADGSLVWATPAAGGGGGGSAVVTPITASITASDTLGGQGDPPAAFDGNAGSYWHSAGAVNSWLAWAYPTPQALSQIQITNRTDYPSRYATEINVQSYNGSAWVTVRAFPGLAAGVQTLDLPASTARTQWRIFQVSSAASPPYWNIAEVVTRAFL